MERGLLDLGILLEPVDISKYEFIQIPVKEEWGVLVPDDSPLAGKESVRPEDLVSYPLLFGQREMVHQQIRNWFGSCSAKMKLVASGNLQYNMAAMVSGKVGVAVTIRLDCRYDGISFVPLAPRLESRTVLVWKKVQPFSPAATAFIDFFRDYVEKE